MTNTDYIANNVWHLQEQVKRLRKMAGALMDEALALEKSAGYIQTANRKRLNMAPSLSEQREWDRMTSAEQEAWLATESGGKQEVPGDGR